MQISENRAGDTAQLQKNLPCKCEVLSFIPSAKKRTTTKKKSYLKYQKIELLIHKMLYY